MARHSKLKSKRKPADPRLIERLKKAKETADKEHCQARNVKEFERTLPCSLIASFLGGQDGLLADLVVENAWVRFLEEAGDPADPIERVMLFQFFMLHYRSLPLYAHMAANGTAGYRIMGGLASKMTRSMMTLSATLRAWRQEREKAEESRPNAKPSREKKLRNELDREAEQANLLAVAEGEEERGRKRRYRAHQRAERARIDALPPEERAAHDAREREIEEQLALIEAGVIPSPLSESEVLKRWQAAS